MASSPTLRSGRSSSAILQWAISHIPADNILLVKTAGPITASTWPPFVLAVNAASAAHHCRRFLFDHRDSELDFSTMETYENPNQLKQFNCPPGFIGAMVFRTATEITKFLDDRFANTATNLRVCYDFDQARNWLLGVVGPAPHPVSPFSPFPPVTLQRKC